MNYTPHNALYFLIFIILINISTFMYAGDAIIKNYNTKVCLIVWIISIYFYYIINNVFFLLLPVLLLTINEILYINFNLDIFDGQSRTALWYDMITIHMIKHGNNNTNLTEGLYLKNLYDENSLMNVDESRINKKEANHNRFRKFFIDLNISKQEYSKIKLLDMGCGNGDFIKYCKSLGIEASGLSICEEQIKELKKQGLDVYLGSYRELQPQFIGKYDIITCWGSLEHITHSYPCSKSGEEKSKNILKNMMGHFKQYYKKDSEYKFLFNTTLHMNKKYCNDPIMYMNERCGGSWYFYDDPNNRIGKLIEKDGFKELYNKDYTYHYYMATKIDSTHFGNPSKLNIIYLLVIIFGIFSNPQIIIIVMCALNGNWMWQFDGKLHTKGKCDDCDFEFDRSKRPTTLIWSLNKLV